MNAQIDAWKHTYRERTVDPQSDHLLVLGARQQFLMLETKEPCRDYTGGGGVMPLGHGHPQVSESIQELVKYFYQTGPFTLQGIQMEFLQWIGKHFHRDWRYQFCASENDALYGVADAFGVRQEEVEWINRQPPHWEMDTWDDSVSKRPSVIVVAPINPETYETLSKQDLEYAIGYEADSRVKIIWDETVLGMGWRGTTVFNTPFWADGVVLGGAVGGGIPLGVIGGADQSPLTGQGRLAGSGIGITAGLHTLRQLMVKTAHSDTTALVERLEDKLVQLHSENKMITQHTGEGLLRAIRLPNDKIAREFVSQCRKEGALFAIDGQYVKISMPLVCQLQDVDEMFAIITKAIREVQEIHG